MTECGRCGSNVFNMRTYTERSVHVGDCEVLADVEFGMVMDKVECGQCGYVYGQGSEQFRACQQAFGKLVLRMRADGKVRHGETPA